MGVQDALFMNNILKSLGLKVKLPTLASIDNGRAVDIGYNWSVGRRTHHVEVKQNFLQKLKEAGILEFHWVYTTNNKMEMFTKIWLGQNTIGMLQDCLGMTNTTALHRMGKAMSEGRCQELQSALDWKSKKASGVKTQEIKISMPEIK